MANIVVTSTTNSIIVDFGDYAGGDIPLKRCYNKSKDVLYMSQESDMVTVLSEGSPLWQLAFESTSGCFIVDSINASAPTSNSDLFTKLIALIA